MAKTPAADMSLSIVISIGKIRYVGVLPGLEFVNGANREPAVFCENNLVKYDCYYGQNEVI